MNQIEIKLSWPPSVNHYWLANGNRRFISARGRSFRSEVILTIKQLNIHCFEKEDRLRLEVYAYPPDKRRRDLDNILKSIADSLQHAGVYDDDSQIDELYVERMPDRLGKIRVIISCR